MYEDPITKTDIQQMKAPSQRTLLIIATTFAVIVIAAAALFVRNAMAHGTVAVPPTGIEGWR